MLTESRWSRICKYRTNSIGVHVTAEAPLIHVTTSTDSLVTFRLQSSGPTSHGNPPSEILKPISMDTEQAYGMHHLTLTLPTPNSAPSAMDVDEPPTSRVTGIKLNLMSTKTGTLIGRPTLPSDPSAPTTSPTTQTSLPSLFSAQLPRSLTRLRLASVRPPWKPATVPGVLEDRIVGTAVDGTITGLAILDLGLWRRLRWLQTLCERCKEICPHSSRHAHGTFLGERDAAREGALPMGFSTPTSTDNSGGGLGLWGGGGGGRMGNGAYKATDMHINGDVLKRLLDQGAEDRLRQMLHAETERKDAVADWVREHVERELEAVDRVVEELRKVLDRWF